jgi:phosphohistidine phosphatase
MQNIFILRHGHAQELGEVPSNNDFDRRLTEEGIDKVSKISSFLNKMDESIELILSSPFLRAKETAEIVAKTLLPKPDLKIVDFLACGSSSREIAKGLLTYNALNNVLLVGHAPDLEAFLGKLILAERIKLKKAAMAKIALSNGVELSGELVWLVVPKVVKKLKLKEDENIYQHKLGL